MTLNELIESLGIVKIGEATKSTKKRPLYYTQSNESCYIHAMPITHGMEMLTVGIAINPDQAINAVNLDEIIKTHVRAAIIQLIDELKTEKGKTIAHEISIPQIALDFAGIQ